MTREHAGMRATVARAAPGGAHRKRQLKAGEPTKPKASDFAVQRGPELPCNFPTLSRLVHHLSVPHPLLPRRARFQQLLGSSAREVQALFDDGQDHGQLGGVARTVDHELRTVIRVLVRFCPAQTDQFLASGRRPTGPRWPAVPAGRSAGVGRRRTWLAEHQLGVR